jgi:predicted MFS family arabinose efflux permease
MRLLRPRAATSAIFFISGAVLATWSADIPAVRDRLGISTAAMSAVILLMGIATVFAGLLAGQLLARLSTARMTRIGVVITPISGAAAVVAPSPILLATALLVLGATYGLLDISMNAHGVAIEKRVGATIMSSLHGSWSIGGLVGAAAVAVGGLLGVDPRAEGVVFLGALVALGVWIGSRLPAEHHGRAGGVDAGGGPSLVLPTGGVIAIGCLTVVAFAVEGVVLDWSSLFVVQDTTGGATLGAGALAGFSAGMALGRLVGDAANRRIGPTALLQLGMAGSAVSLLVLVATGAAWLAVPALFLTGVGSANAAPVLLSAAGRSPDMTAGAAIAATTTMGNLGMLVISPVLGVAAEFSSLSVTLAVAGALAAVGAVGARAAVLG